MKAPAGATPPTKQAAPKATAKTAQAKPMATERKTETAKAAPKPAQPKSTDQAKSTESEAAVPKTSTAKTAEQKAAPAKAPAAKAVAAQPAETKLKAAATRSTAPTKSEAPPKAEPATKAAAEAQAPPPSMPAQNTPEPIIQAPIRPAPPPKPLGNAGKDFKAGDFVVYPTHGVGQVQGIEEVPVAGLTLKVIVVTFEENRMTLKVPMAKAASSGLRKLASEKVMGEALETLRGRARIKRTMWSRRAQEYEQKINSGDPIAIAEVVRDLHRNAGQPDQSFSERQIYELALDRLAAEVGALDCTDKAAATQKLLDHLKTSEKAEKGEKTEKEK
ncbi:CarD family transcriptional regulator [Roseomonas xinghualingensis]|uniref:CarD family transcriptional regulator n=1 Tax=Roseomonas xinghualingensis TaxID=2986475 RepID=UPI0021F0A750|nr:CarD family transcriptional regulator [Roseomonas sp. SXEYE001]MCV4207627.1 CarD family transcriptional regulator [Roseomonas sp. SXEYE001]